MLVYEQVQVCKRQEVENNQGCGLAKYKETREGQEHWVYVREWLWLTMQFKLDKDKS